MGHSNIASLKREAKMSHLGKFAAAAVVAMLSATSVAPLAQAQQVYRIVGPDGKVTFSDRPPVTTTGNNTTAVTSKPEGGNAAGNDSGGGVALPYTLQQAVNRYPVTLYSGIDCAPCVSARNLLVARGVPFTERIVDNNEGIAALKNISGNSSIPFGTVGSQRINGFSDTDWNQNLDAAGYPKKSQLPPGYQRPAALPLAASQTTPKPDPAEQAANKEATRRPAAPADVAPSTPSPTNPTGLVF